MSDWAAAGRTTTSSPNVLATISSGAGTFSNFVDVILSHPSTQIGAFLGNDQTQPDAPSNSISFTLELFDVQDVSIGSTTIATNANTSVDQFLGMQSDVEFVRGRFTHTSDNGGRLSLALDDLRFNVVPEPTTALLLGFGLAGMAAARKRTGRQTMPSERDVIDQPGG